MAPVAPGTLGAAGVTRAPEVVGAARVLGAAGALGGARDGQHRTGRREADRTGLPVAKGS